MTSTILSASVSASAVGACGGKGRLGGGRDCYLKSTAPRDRRRVRAVAAALPRDMGSHSVGLKLPTAPCHRLSQTVTFRDVRRMGGRVDPSDQWWTKGSPLNVRDCNSMDQFLGELANAGDNLVVVDFYARWCGACRALYPKLCKLAVANPDAVFLKIEFDDNKDLCRSMGVKVLPYFHMYKGKEGKVAGFSASVSKVSRLKEALVEHGGSDGSGAGDVSTAGNIVPSGNEQGKESKQRETSGASR